MEVDDLAFRGLAHPHVVNLADESDIGRDGVSASRTAATRSFGASRPASPRICSGSMWVSTSTSGPSSGATRRLEPVRDVVAAASDRLPSTSRSSEIDSRPPIACTVT